VFSSGSELRLLREDSKTQPGRGKPPSPTSPGADTQGARNSLMTKKSRNQYVPVEEIPEPWPPITNGPATTAHSATTQAGGWHAGDGTRERMRHSKGIFLTRPEIRPMRGSNPRPRDGTREPQPSGMRTFRATGRFNNLKDAICSFQVSLGLLCKIVRVVLCFY
jgi:hypothetical protein